LPVIGKGWDFFRDEETTIGRQAFEDNFFERELKELAYVF
jgi:hypothetical protein